MKTLILITLFISATAAFGEKKPKAPREFATQILEPTGGKIRRPKGWFFTESHGPSWFGWIVSREDPAKGSYTTGFRIQMIVGVRKGTGKSPKQFVMDYIASKKKEATVLKSCDPKDQGMFTRICLETEEGPHHILYSLFWGNELDWVVVTIAGTTKELWSTYWETFDRMGPLDLIDMSRFEK